MVGGEEPVPGIKVSVYSKGMLQPQLALTDKDGRFFLGNLGPGTYELHIDEARFKTHRTPVVLAGGRIADVDVELTDRSVAQPTDIDRVRTAVPDFVGFEHLVAYYEVDEERGDWSQVARGEDDHTVLLVFTAEDSESLKASAEKAPAQGSTPPEN